MIINCDKFFVEELQKAGYDIDYKKLVEIYQKSRKSSGSKAKKKKKEMVDKLLSEMDFFD